MGKKDVKRVKFVLSPTAVFGLGYNAGEVVELPEEQAKELVDAFYAVYVDEKGEILNGSTEATDVKALKAENAQLKEVVKGKDAEIVELKKVIEDLNAKIDTPPAGAETK